MPADSFESPLTLAACGGHTELAALLIERGANMEEVNDEGYTPLMEAVREGHEDVVTLLIHRGMLSLGYPFRELDVHIRFLTGSRNKAVLRMHNEKYAIWPIFMAKSPKFLHRIQNRGRRTRW